MTVTRENRLAEERLQLKQQFTAWCEHPFTELFLSYLRATADAYKDMAVEKDAVNREALAAMHRAFREAAGLSDVVYSRADSDITSRYRNEELRESYPVSVQAEPSDSSGDFGI